MDYFFFILCFLSTINIKIKGLDDFFYDYMDLENTNCIKGIFVWLIIFCHKRGYGIYKKYLFFKIVSNLGQKVVSLFLFYSGFGINESLKKKGNLYVKTLPKKACILFIKFQLIILMFLLSNILIFNNKVTLKIYFLSSIFKSSLGNSNWFAFNIIMFYIYSYLSFRFVKESYFFGIIIISIICIIHSKFVYIYFYPKSIYAVDTILCFVIGFYYSHMKTYIDKILLKNDIYYFGVISMTILIYYKFFSKFSLISISIKNVLFAILVVFISIKVKFNNEFLRFLNSHSFSIYLLQRLVLSIVKRKRIFDKSDFFQISFEFTTIFFISSFFDKYTSFIDKLFKGKNDMKKIKILAF